jgi:hypothetical protein
MDQVRRLMTIAATAAVGVSLIALSAAGAAPPRPEEGAEPVNFKSVCRFSHRAPDDPIVAPGKSGGSHSHDFVGNTSTSASSTQRSLRAAGTTCGRPGDTAAYWAPTLYDGNTALAPRVANIYYLPATKDLGSIQAPPAGLKVVAGDSKATSAQPMRVTRWKCSNEAQTEPSATPPTCPEGTELVLVVRFPDCWNGRQLDSADHKSHLAYSSRGACPGSHPKKLPAISLNLRYPTRGGASIRLSSGSAYSAHADFFNAWDQRELERLVRECLNRGVHCGARGPDRA